jgi:PTS system mannitol-specific IIC component
MPPGVHRAGRHIFAMGSPAMVVKQAADVRLVVFACEAGMGSSLIGANQLKKRVKDLGRDDIKVIHSPVNQIPADTDVVIAHEGLAERARKAAPAAVVLTFRNFLNNAASDRLIRSLTAGEEISADAGPGS